MFGRIRPRKSSNIRSQIPIPKELGIERLKGPTDFVLRVHQKVIVKATDKDTVGGCLAEQSTLLGAESVAYASRVGNAAPKVTSSICLVKITERPTCFAPQGHSSQWLGRYSDSRNDRALG